MGSRAQAAGSLSSHVGFRLRGSWVRIELGGEGNRGLLAVPRPAVPIPESVEIGLAAAEVPTQTGVSRSPNKRWPCSIKAPIFVRQRTKPVVVSVPKRLRTRVALAWADTPPASSVRLRSCSTTGVGADGWTGGLFLKSRSPLCLSLVVSIRNRKESVPFAIGRRC